MYRCYNVCVKIYSLQTRNLPHIKSRSANVENIVICVHLSANVNFSACIKMNILSHIQKLENLYQFLTINDA